MNTIAAMPQPIQTANVVPPSWWHPRNLVTVRNLIQVCCWGGTAMTLSWLQAKDDAWSPKIALIPVVGVSLIVTALGLAAISFRNLPVPPSPTPTQSALFPQLKNALNQTLVGQEVAQEQLALGKTLVPTLSRMRAVLDEDVVGQEQAKETVTQAVYFHASQLDQEERGIAKGNILLAGPSGSGKTFMIETLSRALNIPMATADASKLTPEGYLGPKIHEVFRSLLMAADGDVEKAEKGIIFLDEIDKVFEDIVNIERRTLPTVQPQLLRLIQGDLISFQYEGRQVHLRTDKILFVFAGAFHRITSQPQAGPLSDEQLIACGVRPEFLGRIGYITQLAPLSREQIKNILTHGPHSPAASWTRLFARHRLQLTLKEETIERLVDEAIAKPTGARGLHFALRRLLSPPLAQHILQREQQTEAVPETTLLESIEV